MGIDVYMSWDNMTKAEKDARYTGFLTDHGHVGYLREAYHGGPYATKVLVPEAFGNFDNSDYNRYGFTRGAPIKASTLRERLPLAMATAIARSTIIYNNTVSEDDVDVKAFTDFVKLAERKEAEGHQIYVYASY